MVYIRFCVTENILIGTVYRYKYTAHSINYKNSTASINILIQGYSIAGNSTDSVEKAIMTLFISMEMVMLLLVLQIVALTSAQQGMQYC